MSQPRNQWKRTRQQARTRRHEAKRRDKRNGYRPGTHTNAQRRSQTARNVVPGPSSPLDWFWRGIQPVKTRQRQKVI